MDWRVRSLTHLLWTLCVLVAIDSVRSDQRVVCYYTNWSVYRPGTAKFSPQNINPYLCTHLIYAFGGFTKDNTLKPFDKYQDIEKGGYAKFTGLKTYNKDLKTMLAIGGWNEGSTRFSPMVADASRRKEFVKNTVKFLRQNHFDGLDLDWEYPAFRDGGKPRDRDNYANLVQELREEYERESSKTGRPRLLLTMAVPAGIEYIDKGYDIPRLNKYLDFINLLSYDYHSSYEPAVNHHSPLYPLEEDNEYNYDAELTIDYTIKYLLSSGASADKIVLGIPTYGRSYTLINEDATDIGAPADGPGEEGDATREKGYLAYYEICESLINSDDWEVVSPNANAMGPYAYKGNQWVGYDDEAVVRLKAEYVTEKGLGGIMFWSIDNDDFRGKCHGRPYPLIEAAKEALLASAEKEETKHKSGRPTKSRTENASGNFIGRRLGAGRRRTTEAPTRKSSTLSKSRNRNQQNFEEKETKLQANGRNRGQFFEPEDEQEDNDDERIVSNAVRSIEYSEDETKPPANSRDRNRIRDGQGRRRRPENSRRRSTTAASVEETTEAGSNKITTPRPPTTPDPGSDFKCEDEGFFSHPRDCKKYFWCLDAGPGGLGIVAHQFTCPSGLVFNKAADSCDYPRNVICPKSKDSSSDGPTTRAPIVAATSRTTRIQSSTRRTTTTTKGPIEDEEDYEYYDESAEDDLTSTTTTTAKPLQYKTITRNRPTTTTTTTTTTQVPKTVTPKSYQSIISRGNNVATSTPLDGPEEDPLVIKELIELIKKAGGIEELEKQLNIQIKNGDGSVEASPATSNADSTPATISRSLYDRVLNRQAGKAFPTLFRTTASSLVTSTTEIASNESPEPTPTARSRPVFRNGPGQAQFEGLDDIPEVRNLRREKPQYVTINRQRPSTSAPDTADESSDDDDEDEDDDDDVNENDKVVASSEDKPVNNSPDPTIASRRSNPSYINIRRGRPTTPSVPTEDGDGNEENGSQTSTTIANSRRNRFPLRDETSSTTSRYIAIQRVRSTTQATEDTSFKNDANEPKITSSTTEFVSSSEPNDTGSETYESTLTPETITSSPHVEEPVVLTTTPIVQVVTTQAPDSDPTTSLPVQSLDFSTSISSPTTVKPVQDTSDTTPSPIVSSSTPSSESSSDEPSAQGSATVFQPRPFGFQRRIRPQTTPVTSSPETSSTFPVTTDRGPINKVSAESVRLPTLKELIGYETIFTHDYTSTTPLTLSIRNFSEDYEINLNERNNDANKMLYPITKNNIISKSSSTNIDNVKNNRLKTEDEKNAFENQKTVEGGKKAIDQNYSTDLPVAETTTTPYIPVTIPIRILSGNRKKFSRTRPKKIVIPVRIFEFDTPLTEVAIEVPESELPNGLNSSLRFEVINQHDITIINRINNDKKKFQYRGSSENHDDQSARRRTNEPTEKHEFTNYMENENSPIFTTPKVSTIRGTSWTPTTKSGNRGFYVTKSLDSNTLLDEFESTTPMEVDKSHDEFDSTLDIRPTEKSSILTFITDGPVTTIPEDSITPVELNDVSEMPDKNTSTEVDKTVPALEDFGKSKSYTKPELFQSRSEEDGKWSAENLSAEESSDENETSMESDTTIDDAIHVPELTTVASDEMISTVSDVDDLLALPSTGDSGKLDSDKKSVMREVIDFVTENSDIEISSSLPDETSATTDANVDMMTRFFTSNTAYEDSEELYSATSQYEVQRVSENHNLTMSVESTTDDSTITESATDTLRKTSNAHSEVTDGKTHVETEWSTEGYHDFYSVTPDSITDVEQTTNYIDQFSTMLNSKGTTVDFASNLNTQSTTTPYFEEDHTSTIEFEKNIERQPHASSDTVTSDFGLTTRTELSGSDVEAKKQGLQSTVHDFIEWEATTSYTEKTTDTQASHDSWNHVSSDSIVTTEASNLEEKTEARSTTPYFSDTTTDLYSEVENQTYATRPVSNTSDLEFTMIGDSWNSNTQESTPGPTSTEMTGYEQSETPELNEVTDPTTTLVTSTVGNDDQNLTTTMEDLAHDDEDAEGMSIAPSEATTLDSTTDFSTTIGIDVNPTSTNYQTLTTSSEYANWIFPVDDTFESDPLTDNQSTDGETTTREVTNMRMYDEQQLSNNARRTSILTTARPTTSSRVFRRPYRPFVSGTNPTVDNNRRNRIKIIRRRPSHQSTVEHEARDEVNSTSTNRDEISNGSGITRPKIIRRRVINRSTGKIVKEDLVERKIFADIDDRNDGKHEFVGNAMRTQGRENTSAVRLPNRRIIYRNRLAAMNRDESNVSSQHNGASNDVQSSSVLSTGLNKKRRRIVVKRLRSRGTGLTKPSIELQNISSSDSTANTVVETRVKTTDGRGENERREIDNSYGGSEIFSRISTSGNEAPVRTQSFFEAQVRGEATVPLGTEQADSEINLFKNRASQSRKPGTLVRQSKFTVKPESELSSTSAPSTQFPASTTRRRNFRAGQRPITPIQQIVDEAQSRSVVRQGDTGKFILDGETSESINQSRRAEEPPTTVSAIQQTTVSPSVVTGRPLFRTAIRRRISTTVTPRVEVPPSTTTTAVIRQRQRPQPFEKVSPNAPVRSRRPAIVDYDYYEDEEKRVVGKPKLSGKISVTTQGTIRCLDQGNFPHPQSCKKFITCARMVNGQVIATEYTCPDKLSFDPVGGICNWSAGLGCKE